jgi:hypothetical protein
VGRRSTSSRYNIPSPRAVNSAVLLDLVPWVFCKKYLPFLTATLPASLLISSPSFSVGPGNPPLSYNNNNNIYC